MSTEKISRRRFLKQGAGVAGAAGLAARGAAALGQDIPAPEKILNYSKDMEYRRLGKTGLWVSAVCLGGHWKKMDRIVPGVFKKGGGWMEVEPSKIADFDRNRYEVVSRCIEAGMNYVDACAGHEITAYARALKGRRDKMYFGFSWYEKESRFRDWRTCDRLMQGLEEGMKEAGLDYVDLWRISLLEKSSNHTQGEIEEAVKALEKAKQQGKARFTGFSSHDRPHIRTMIETYPKQVEVIVTPYTAKSKELPQDSLFEAVRAQDVGLFGIKPFASGSLFKGGGAPDGPDAEEDSTRARMAIRHILCNPAVTAPIPGLITTAQVDNIARAVKERRELDGKEKGRLDRAMDEAWAKLPPDYQWLKNWEWV
jgi:aryl-alcohol dehydrogenase-like predicted oxidoreductase